MVQSSSVVERGLIPVVVVKRRIVGDASTQKKSIGGGVCRNGRLTINSHLFQLSYAHLLYIVWVYCVGRMGFYDITFPRSYPTSSNSHLRALRVDHTLLLPVYQGRASTSTALPSSEPLP